MFGLACAGAIGCGVCPGVYSAGGGYCQVQWGSCSGHHYEVDCGPVISQCRCTIDGVQAASFAPGEIDESVCFDSNLVSLVKKGCNWTAPLGTPNGVPASDAGQSG